MKNEEKTISELKISYWRKEKIVQVLLDTFILELLAITKVNL